MNDVSKHDWFIKTKPRCNQLNWEGKVVKTWSNLQEINLNSTNKGNVLRRSKFCYFPNYHSFMFIIFIMFTIFCMLIILSVLMFIIVAEATLKTFLSNTLLKPFIIYIYIYLFLFNVVILITIIHFYVFFLS